MAITGFAEMTREARDPHALARFYIEAFGLPMLADEGDKVWLGVGAQARLGLWTPGRKVFGDKGGVHVHFAFAVEQGSIDELAVRVRQAGGDARGPVEHPGGDRSLYVSDPVGNVVEAWDLFDEGMTVEEVRDCHGGASALTSPAHAD